MGLEEERNRCPDCGGIVPLAVPDCPHCGRVFHPSSKRWLPWYRQCWLLALKTTGRACPAEFLSYILPNGAILLWLCCYLAHHSLQGASLREALLNSLGATLATGWLLISLVPLPALIMRRLHDTDIGLADLDDEAEVLGENIRHDMPWYLHLPMLLKILYSFSLFKNLLGHSIPLLAGLVYLPVFLFRDSLPGPNRFGPGTAYPRYLDRF